MVKQFQDDTIEKLPVARDGIKVAVESYVEIGRAMREKLAKLEMALQ